MPNTKSSTHQSFILGTQLKSPGVAILLSFIFTGAGQIYAGSIERGAIQLIIYFVLCFLAFATGIFFIALIPYWGWGMFDANNVTKTLNSALQATFSESQETQDEIEQNAKMHTTSLEFVTQLEKISKLHRAGILDELEFTKRKSDLIVSLMSRGPKEDAEDFLTALITSIERKFLTEAEVLQIKKIVL